MPFTITDGTAQSVDINNSVYWGTQMTVQQAQRWAVANPSVICFFYCNEDVCVQGNSWPAQMAVFFMGGGPVTPISAAGCTLYQPSYLNVGYNADPGVTAQYTLTDGRQFYDIACIWNAQILPDSQGNAALCIPSNIQSMLEGDTVKNLQALGMTVLLTVIGTNEAAGWSCFTSYSAAQAWAQLLAQTTTKYGLDGIDIDDEYSTCPPNAGSMIMAVYALREAGVNVVTKALFEDTGEFPPIWATVGLPEALTYGWYMGYGAPCTALDAYGPGGGGMQPNQLLMGVDVNSQTDPTSWAQCVTQNQYGGMMIFQAGADQTSYLSDISQVEFGLSTTTSGVLVPRDSRQETVVSRPDWPSQWGRRVRRPIVPSSSDRMVVIHDRAAQ